MPSDCARATQLRIAIVAGETSGDALGAGLIRTLRHRYPNVSVEGICGPKMCAEGATTLFDMHAISIMGLDGLFGSLFKILRIRRELRQRFLETRPDLFIGIDVPDFNLTLEEHLKRGGIPTVHYVSPTVWAWRSYRIHKIRRAVTRILTLFPFEEQFYQKQGVPVSFVGHPLADEISEQSVDEARQTLGLSDAGRIVALLPGSRKSEVSRLAPLFAETAARLLQQVPNLHFVIPSAGEQVQALLKQALEANLESGNFTIVNGQARTVLRSAEVTLLASGTAALEAALVATPMVVAYKVSPLSYRVMKAFSTVEHYSMPNHLLDEPIVPEFIQNDATVDNLVGKMNHLLVDASANQRIREALSGIKDSLRCNANQRAADAIDLVLRGEK